MKKLTLILLLTVWSCLFSSRAEARPPLESGTHTWRQVTYGTLGLTLSVIPYVYMLEKSQPIQRRFKSENPTFLGRCMLKGVDRKILNPKASWFNKELYDSEAKKLAKLFKKNFLLYGKEVEYLIKSGPII